MTREARAHRWPPGARSSQRRTWHRRGPVEPAAIDLNTVDAVEIGHGYPALGIHADPGVDGGDEWVVEHDVTAGASAHGAVHHAVGAVDAVPDPHAVMPIQHFDD